MLVEKGTQPSACPGLVLLSPIFSQKLHNDGLHSIPVCSGDCICHLFLPPLIHSSSRGFYALLCARRREYNSKLLALSCFSVPQMQCKQQVLKSFACQDWIGMRDGSDEVSSLVSAQIRNRLSLGGKQGRGVVLLHVSAAQPQLHPPTQAPQVLQLLTARPPVLQALRAWCAVSRNICVCNVCVCASVCTECGHESQCVEIVSVCEKAMSMYVKACVQTVVLMCVLTVL